MKHMIPTREQFLKRIDVFLAKHQMGESTLSWRAAKDPNFVRELRGGRSVGLDLLRRVDDFMVRYG